MPISSLIIKAFYDITFKYVQLMQSVVYSICGEVYVKMDEMSMSKTNKLNTFIRCEFRYIIFANSFINLLQIFLSIISAKLLSAVITEATKENIRNVLFIAVILLCIVFGKSVMNILAEIALEKRKIQKVHNCKLKFYQLFFQKPLKDLYLQKLGETKEKINDDFQAVIEKYNSYYPNFIVGLLSGGIYFTYICFMNQWIALVLLFISILQIVPPLIIKRFLQVNYDNCRDIEAEITNFTMEGYRGFLLIKLYNLKGWWESKLAGYHKQYSKIGRFSIYTGTMESVLDDLISKILSYGTYGIIGLLILKNIATLDIGIQAITLSGSFYGAVKISFDLIKNLAVCQRAEKRLTNLFENVDETGSEITQGDIEISKLSYSYGEEEILSNINISLDSTQLTVIKGCNGSGKSTLLRLLVGVLESQEGTITVDGIRPEELSSANFPEKIFYLPQDDHVFSFSPYELYCMVSPMKKEQAIELAKRFGLKEELICESKIDELSGGERKKVFLSLAFAVEPVVMLLDEPTNSLDEDGKLLLKKLLKNRNGGAIIITHDGFLDDISDNEYVIEKEV